MIQSEKATYPIPVNSNDAIASFLGAHLAGNGRADVTKMFGAMNIAPLTKEDHYEKIDQILLTCIKTFQDESMQAAICKHFCKEEIACFCFFLYYFLLDDAADDNDGDPTALTVSGDGTWQRCGFKSIHGVAAILSSNTTLKVIDVQRLSRTCLICTGALSVKNIDPDLYDEIIHNHDRETNYDGSSGKLGFVYQRTENKSMLNFYVGGMESQGVQDILRRSIPKYQIQYTRYVQT